MLNIIEVGSPAYHGLLKEAAETAYQAVREMQKKSEPLWMKSKEARAYFKVTQGTLQRWKDKGLVDFKEESETDHWYDVNSYPKIK